MKYRFGNSKKIKEQGKTLPIVCPKCSSKSEFSVFSNSETRLKADLPFFKSGSVYLLVCSKCSAMFTVDSEKGNSFKKGEKLSIGNYDLKELERFEI